jgi:hypothetical protein
MEIMSPHYADPKTAEALLGRDREQFLRMGDHSNTRSILSPDRYFGS